MSLVPDTARAVGALNRQIFRGLAVAILLTCAVGSWAALGEIQEAVIAPGVVAVSSEKKKVQHPDGGIISEIDVQDGVEVNKGAVLLRLDGKQLSADMRTVQRRTYELSAKKWRLQTEAYGLPNLPVWHAPIASLKADDDALSTIGAEQRQLFTTKKKVLEQQKLQLHERIDQLAQETEGLDAVEQARRNQLAIARQELAKLAELAKKGLVPMTRWTPVQREEAQLVGDMGQTEAEKAKVRGQVAELQQKILEIDQNYRKEALDELQAVEGELSALIEKHNAIDAKLQHLEIRASVSGRIQELAVHTIGGVIAAGEVLAFIVPQHDDLVIDARVPPREIDRISKGAPARVRFTSFDRTTTPELEGHVDWISADQELSGDNKVPAFKVRVSINSREYNKLGGSNVGAGMEAEVMFTGSRRKVISYIAKPLTDQLQRTFRER